MQSTYSPCLVDFQFTTLCSEAVKLAGAHIFNFNHSEIQDRVLGSKNKRLSQMNSGI